MRHIFYIMHTVFIYWAVLNKIERIQLELRIDTTGKITCIPLIHISVYTNTKFNRNQSNSFRDGTCRRGEAVFPHITFILRFLCKQCIGLQTYILSETAVSSYCKAERTALLTFLKSTSCVIRVPSERWNSSVTASSVTFAVIVSWSTSPPYKQETDCRAQDTGVRWH
jgi:hypothetical protein